MKFEKNYLVEKRNVLNEIRVNNMTLQELRFFSIYLAKINARDISTREVRFPMAAFQAIMNMGRLNMVQLQQTTDNLLCKIVKIPLESGGYKAFQLFKRCRVDRDENGDWYVEIDAHDDALPLMFDFKEKYFAYEVWNALRLKSSNQLRMYEILKQYEKVKERIVPLADLKELLGLNASEYPRYSNFRLRVLEACKEALEIYTDIKFTYEPVKKGKGGRVTAIKFKILRNTKHEEPLYLDGFIEPKEFTFEDERLEFLAEACNNEFTEVEMQVLYNIVSQIIPHEVGVSPQEYQIKAYDLLKMKYDELNWKAERTEIQNRVAYLKKMLEVELIMRNT